MAVEYAYIAQIGKPFQHAKCTLKHWFCLHVWCAALASWNILCVYTFSPSKKFRFSLNVPNIVIHNANNVKTIFLFAVPFSLWVFFISEIIFRIFFFYTIYQSVNILVWTTNIQYPIFGLWCANEYNVLVVTHRHKNKEQQKLRLHWYL